VQFDQFRWYLIKVAAGLIGDARVSHATKHANTSDHIESVGKPRLPQGGKQRVNKISESRNGGFPRLQMLFAVCGPVPVVASMLKRKMPGQVRA
jgi:hypothetical protein